MCSYVCGICIYRDIACTHSEKEKRNILEIKLTKRFYGDEGTQSKPENLSLEKIGELMFDVIKFKVSECERVALVTN